VSETRTKGKLHRRIAWRLGEVIEVVPETRRTKSLILGVPGWEGHKVGQHVDVRLTAPDGYQAQRSYSIGLAPEDGRLMLTVDRLEEGEVSPYLTEVLEVGDRLELRGPIGGCFTWEAGDGGPLLLAAGGLGVVPLVAMIRHRTAVGGDVPARLLYSSRSYEEIIYREGLERLATKSGSLDVFHTLTRSRPNGWNGYERRIDHELHEEVGPLPKDRPLIFVCGPRPLVEAVATALVNLEHDPTRVKSERFGPTGG
jgi:ferredoxin-NADP reductase